MGVGLDAEVRTRLGRAQIGDRRAAPEPVAREELVVAHPLLIAAVEIVGAADAEFPRALDDPLNELVLVADIGAPERAVAPVGGACARVLCSLRMKYGSTSRQDQP